MLITTNLAHGLWLLAASRVVTGFAAIMAQLHLVRFFSYLVRAHIHESAAIFGLMVR